MECVKEFLVKNAHGTYGQHILACPKLKEKANKKAVQDFMSPSKKRPTWDPDPCRCRRHHFDDRIFTPKGWASWAM
eukprot:gene16482-22704_t